MSISEGTTPTAITTNMKSPPVLSTLFASLSSSNTSTQSLSLLSKTPRRWHLHRILRSDNPADINGELHGIATFHPLLHTPSPSPSGNKHREMVYKEEGEMPSSARGMAGLKWTKKYIWRLNNSSTSENNNNNNATATATSEESTEAGGISVWFVKIQSGKERKEDNQDEPDYLFHEFDFGYANRQSQQQGDRTTTTTTTTTTESVSLKPPMPPQLTSPSLMEKYPETKVIQATGDHLCIKDMYYTAYSFRIVPETGEVLSWASRHIVKGPKKNQDILNLYSME